MRMPVERMAQDRDCFGVSQAALFREPGKNLFFCILHGFHARPVELQRLAAERLEASLHQDRLGIRSSSKPGWSPTEIRHGALIDDNESSSAIPSEPPRVRAACRARPSPAKAPPTSIPALFRSGTQISAPFQISRTSFASAIWIPESIRDR